MFVFPVFISGLNAAIVPVFRCYSSLCFPGHIHVDAYGRGRFVCCISESICKEAKVVHAVLCPRQLW